MSASNTKRLSATELRERRAKGESRTDWARVDAKTEAELARDIATDPDWKNIPPDWHLDAIPVAPGTKKLLSLRVDPDVVDWFRAQGPGYQTRMNAVLRAFMTAASKPR
ncbi:BrnA antitoxin family protein [Roseococcus thiosulfatophilus]|uniref:BrnA antitoxin family protein n=1 Tax=Roseococcus thiosulfatophilus TaxID=35813 RepID=UPI0030F3ACA2